MAFALEGPILVEVQQGKSATATIRILATSRPYRNVSLSITGLPSGVSADFTPLSGRPSFQSTLTLHASYGSATGTFTVIVTARDAKSSKSMPIVFRNVPGPNVPPPISPAQPFTADVWLAKAGDGGSDSNDGLSEGAPKLTLAAAITRLNTEGGGKKLAIKNGTWSEGFGASEAGLPPSGSIGAPTIVIAKPGHTVTVTRGITFSAAGGASYITFDRINVDGEPNDIGVYFGSGNDHLRLINCDVKNTLNNGGAGMISGGGAFCEFNNVDIHGAGTPNPGGFDQGAYGVYWWGNNSLFYNCRVYDNGGSGIICYHDGFTDVDDNVIDSCVFYNNGNDDGTRGSRNSVLLIGSGSNNLAMNNIIYNNTGSFVGYALTLGFGNQSNNRAYNNTVYGNTGALGGIEIRADAPNSIVRNNIALDNPGPGIEDYSSGSTVDTNIDDNSGTTAAAELVNPGVDFHLKSTATARNAGATIAVVTLDADGRSRPLGSAYCVGAYEFVE